MQGVSCASRTKKTRLVVRMKGCLDTYPRYVLDTSRTAPRFLPNKTPGILPPLMIAPTKNNRKWGLSQGPVDRGGFKRRGFPNLDLSILSCPFLSFLDLSRFSGVFPFFSGFLSRLFLSLFLSVLETPTRTFPKGPRHNQDLSRKEGNPWFRNPLLPSLNFQVRGSFQVFEDSVAARQKL